MDYYSEKGKKLFDQITLTLDFTAIKFNSWCTMQVFEIPNIDYGLDECQILLGANVSRLDW